tara:strand:+ start:132 stop:401 length:270 start_codon:yes stop_codon:yes gene_type:complete
MKPAPRRFIWYQGDWPSGVLLLPVMERYAMRKITDFLRVNVFSDIFIRSGTAPIAPLKKTGIVILSEISFWLGYQLREVSVNKNLPKVF